jgi:hypothetical protein
MQVNIKLIQQELRENWISREQIEALIKLDGMNFYYTWQLYDSLSSISDKWTFREATRANKLYNQTLKNRLNYIYKKFTVPAVVNQ